MVLELIVIKKNVIRVKNECDKRNKVWGVVCYFQRSLVNQKRNPINWLDWLKFSSK